MAQRQLSCAIVAAILATGPGCLCWNSRPMALPAECTAACNDVPCPCRNNVYVFLMSGFDPFDLDHVATCRSTLIAAGFNKVYNGQFYHEEFFAREMQRIAAEDPQAQFVVVGFSLGVETAASLAETVGKQGVPVALLGSVDPHWWSSPSRSANVQQVVSYAGNSAETVELLARSLAGIADGLPHPQPPAMPEDAVGDRPTPRPLERTDRPRDSWDFLKPVASLKSLSPSEPVAAVENVREHTSLRPVQP
jgi:hypothetical protein